MLFDHIGLFVADIAEGDARLSALLPIVERSPIHDDPVIQVRVQFLTDSSGIVYELVAPFGEKNPVATVLRTRKNVLNHVAYRVADLDAALERQLAEGGFAIGDPKPAVAFGGRRVVFIYTAMDFIIELIEDPEAAAAP